jgi:glutamate carboxypeptidase
MPTGRDEMLAWIDRQQDRLLETVAAWAAIGSWSRDPDGIAAMQAAAAEACGHLGPVERIPSGPCQEITDAGETRSVPGADILSLRHDAAADRPRVLLGIHLDTVHPPGPGCPPVELGDDGRTLRGPGVADAKGGLAVMLIALEAFKRHAVADRLGWEVFINADEELGSPSSGPFLAAAAARNDLGLLYEPALDTAGTLAGARKGSGNFTFVVRGRAAHAGRHFSDGRNAVAAAARLATACDRLNTAGRDLTVNVAACHGGQAFNVVPDRAILRINLRAAADHDAEWATARLRAAVAEAAGEEGIEVTLHGSFHCPPKPLDGPTRALLDRVAVAGGSLGLAIEQRATGGVCDGNKLAAAGLPTIDTLGVRGGGIHSPAEYLLIESLVERAKLTAVLLADLAEEGLPWGRRPARTAAPGKGASACT